MKKIALLFFVLLGGLLYLAYQMFHQISLPIRSVAPAQLQLTHEPIRYVAVGDSLTFGEGASPETAFPTILTADLAKAGVQITLRNVAVSGYTSEQVIEQELPEVTSLQPNFATVLIGGNDLLQQVPIDMFHQHLITILDHMAGVMPDKRRLIVITIPDFSSVPVAKRYGVFYPIAVAQRINEYNKVIKEEANKRGLPIVDLFNETHNFGNDPTLVSSDGLHPTAKEYAKWKAVVYPVALKSLEENK